MKKRIVSLGLVVTMLLGMCGQAFAVDTESNIEETVETSIEQVETPEIDQGEVVSEPSEEDFDKGMTSAEVAEQVGLLNTTGRRKARAAVNGPYAFVYENGDLVFTSNNVADTTKGEVLLGSISGINTTAYGADLKPEWYAQAKNVRRVIIETDLSPISMAYWFAGCEQLTTFVGLDKIHTENVASLDYLFYQCYGIEEIDLSWLKTGKVTSMAHTFDSMSHLAAIDVSSLDTRNVTNMEGLFRGLAAITEIDISNFVTSKVKTYDYFMYGCQNVIHVDVSSLSVKGMDAYTESGFSNTSNNGTREMFEVCIRLRKIHFGKDFSFRRDTGLPTQSSNYVPLADGYWFNGSQKTSTKGKGNTQDGTNTILPNFVDVWMYAYTPVTVTFDPKNGEPPIIIDKEIGDTIGELPEMPTKEGANFLRWGFKEARPADIVDKAIIFEAIYDDDQEARAVMYSNGTLAFQRGPRVISEYGAVVDFFNGIEETNSIETNSQDWHKHENFANMGVYAERDIFDADGHKITSYQRQDRTNNYWPGWTIYTTYRKIGNDVVPCLDTHIKSVDFADEIHPQNMSYWFAGGYSRMGEGDGHTTDEEANYGFGYWDGNYVIADYGDVEFRNVDNLKLDQCQAAYGTFSNQKYYYAAYANTFYPWHGTDDVIRPMEWSKYFGDLEWTTLKWVSHWPEEDKGMFSQANFIGNFSIHESTFPSVVDADNMFHRANIKGNFVISQNAFMSATSAMEMFEAAKIGGDFNIADSAYPNLRDARSMLAVDSIQGNLTWKNRIWKENLRCMIDNMFCGNISGDVILSGWTYQDKAVCVGGNADGCTNILSNENEQMFGINIGGKLDISSWDLGNVIKSISYLFSARNYGVPRHIAEAIDMSGWTGTAKLTDAEWMLANAIIDKNVDISGINFQSLLNAKYMLYFTKIQGNLNMSQTIYPALSDAFCMFADVNIQGNLDMTGVSFPSLTRASSMFYSAKIYGEPRIELFDSAEVLTISLDDMLRNSRSLKSIDLSAVNAINLTDYTLDSCVLEEIRLGPGIPKIKFPTPNPEYISDADGYWYTATGERYAPDEIPEYTANVYYAITPRTVTFDPANGEDIVSFQVPYMGNAKRPTPDPVKAGHEFIGWGTEDGTLWKFTDPVTKNMTLTAQYIDRSECVAIQYSNGEIVFQRGMTTDASKGSVVQMVRDIEGQTYTAPIWTMAPDSITKATISGQLFPVSTAYWFAGLSNLESIDGLDYVGDIAPDETLSSYMVENTAHMFDGCESLTYLNLGRFSTYKVEDATDMFANMPALDTIVLGGRFEFKDGNYLPENNAEGVWYYGDDYKEYAPESIPGNTGDTRTYTTNIETYTVSFDTGVLGTEYADQSVRFNRKATNPGRPTRPGFGFVKWVDAADTSNNPAEFNFDAAIRANTTVKAVWSPKSNIPYTKEVWIEDLETDSYTKQSSRTLRGTAGAAVAFDVSSVTVPEHYHINTEKSNLTGEILGDGSLALKVMLERDRHTIRFNVDGGEPIESITGAKYQQSVELPTPTKQGFNFLYWTTAMGDPVKSPLVVQRDYALIAKWTALDSVTYTITSYYQNLEDDNYTLGETVTKTGQTNAMVVINSMAPEGFRLNNEKSTVTGNIEGDGTAHFELYFDRILYNVTFDSNGGSEIDGALKVKYGTTLKDVETPVKDGYVFGGWETTIRTDEAGNPLKISIPIVVKDNWALRAVWNTRQTVTVETYEEIPKLPEWRLRHYQEMVGMPKISNKVILIAHKSDPEQLDKYTFQNESDFQKQTKFVLDTSKDGDWQEAAKKLTRSWNGVRAYLCDDTKGRGLYEALQEVFHDLCTEKAEDESITYVILPSKNEDKDIYNETLSSASMDYRTLSVIAPILYKHNLKTTDGTEPTLFEISDAIEKSMTQLCSAAANYKKVWGTTVSEPETVGLLMSTLRYSQRYESAYGLSINGEYVREPVEIKMAQPMYWEPLIATGRSGGRSDNYIKMLPVVALPPMYGYNPDLGLRLYIGIPEYMPRTYIRVSIETMDIPVGQTELTLNVEDLGSLDGTKFHYNLEKSELTASNGETIRVYKDVDKSKLTIQRRIEYPGVDLEQEQDYIEDYNKYGGRLSNSGTVTIVTSVKVDNADEFGYRNGNKDIAGELGQYGFYSHSLTKKEILARKVDDNEKLEKHGIAVSEHVWDMMESALTGYEYMRGEISASNPDVIANLVILPYVGGQLGNADLPLYINGTFVVDSECPGADNIMYRTYGQIRQRYSVLPLWIGSEPGDEMTTETIEHWQAKSDKFFNYASEYNPTGSVSALNHRVRVNAKDTELAELAQLLQSRAYHVNPKAFERYEFQNRFVDTEFYKQFTYEQQESLRNGRNSLAMVWNPDNTVTLGIPKARTLGEVVLEETVYVEPSYIKGVEIRLSGEEMGWGLDGYRLVQDDRYQNGVYSWIPNNVQDLWMPLLYKKTGPILTKDYGAPGTYSVRYTANEDLGFREPSAGRPEGMEFKGWTYVNEDGSLGDSVDVSEGATGRNEPYHIAGLSKNTTIKAVYDAPVVKVHYDLNGADTPTEGWTLEIPVGAPVVSPNVPVTREGYNLSHWSAVEKRPDCDEAYEIWQFGQLARYETYLKAEWIPTHEKTAEYSINVYKQSLDTEVYELSATVTAVGIVGSTVSPTMRAPIGFHDSTSADETGRVGTVTEDGKLKLAYYFDRNEYDVTFVNGSLQETKKYIYGEMVSKEAPAQDGKEFMGWHVVEEDETDKTTGVDQDEAEYQPMPFVATGNIRLQAVWKGVTCNISWDLSDADNGQTIIESGGPNGTGLPTEIEWGQTISEPTITPVKDGYEFTGWVDGNGEPVDWEKTITGQTVIKPAFEKLTYTITWDLSEADNADTVSGTGGPGGGSLVSTIGHGEVLARPIVDPTKEGKDFTGWVYSTDGETWATVTWTKPITQAVTIKPNFADKPVVPSNPGGNGGGGGGGSAPARYWTVDFIGVNGEEITSIRVKDKEAVSIDEALESYITDNENIKWYVMEAGKTGDDLQEFKFSYRVKSDMTVQAYTVGSDEEKKPEGSNFEKNVYDYLNTQDHIAYLIGTDEGLIKPEGGITRAEVAMIMYRLLNTATFDEYYTSMNEFVDVGPEDWFNNAVSTLCNMGIIKGRGDGVFDPNAQITRAEFAAIISRLQPNSNKTMRDFNDVSKEHWAYNEIMTVAENGWTTAGDEEFRPDIGITRAEVTRFMNRVLRRNNVLASGLIDEAHGAKTWADNNDVMAWYYIDIQEASNSHTYNIQGGVCVWTGLSGVEPMK